MSDVPLALGQMPDAFARGLLALGLGPGDHVVLWMPNSIEWNVVNFGIAKIGAAKDQIANFKVPRHVEIVSEFPLTGSGKVQTFKQKAWAMETYGFTGPA